MAKVFVSYSRVSSSATSSLAADLTALGQSVWIDRELTGGQAWWTQILSSIRECDLFIFLLSPEALDSVACRRELSYAEALGKPILPVLVSDGVSFNVLPPSLSSVQYVDYRNPDRVAALALARAVSTSPIAPQLPSPLPTAPDIPMSYLVGIAAKIEQDQHITYEQQAAILVDLRKALRDKGTRTDANRLVRKLRKRRDLLATVAEEIDEIIAATEGQATTLSNPAPSRPIPGAVKPNSSSEQVSLISTVGANSPRSEPMAGSFQLARFATALIGLVLGTSIGSLSMLSLGESDPEPSLFLWGLTTGAAAGLAGAILKGESRGAISFVAFFTLAAWAIAYFSVNTPNSIAVATVMIAPGVMALTALSVLIKRRLVVWLAQTLE